MEPHENSAKTSVPEFKQQVLPRNPERQNVSGTESVEPHENHERRNVSGGEPVEPHENPERQNVEKEIIEEKLKEELKKQLSKLKKNVNIDFLRPRNDSLWNQHHAD